MAPRKGPAAPRSTTAAALERTRSTHREEGSRNAYNRRHHHPERAGVAVTWLRIDDSFGDHPKLLELSRQDRWTFVELLTYCARHNTEGFLPENLHESRRYITAGFLRKCLAAGLLDDTESGLCVHDWKVFNPGKDATGAVRQSRWRNAHRNGSRNGAVTENVTGDITPSRARGPSRPLKPSSNNGSLDAADADEHTQLERLNTLLAQAAIEDMGP